MSVFSFLFILFENSLTQTFFKAFTREMQKNSVKKENK